HEIVTSWTDDIRSLESLIQAMHTAQPEIAFHLAAQPLVRKSYQSPVETFDVNIMGTVHFLEAVRQTPSVKVAIVITSDKCYENREWPWGYRESDNMGGHDPYSSSKGCAELVTAAYRASYLSQAKVQVATVRAGNVIGGGDWSEDRLIPDMVRAFSSGQKLDIRAPKAIRPWQHVLEPLRGYLLLAKKMWQKSQDCCSGWNFGPSEKDICTVEEVIAKSATLWGNKAQWSVAPGPHPHEATTLKLDCSKANSLLNWRPVFNLDVALEWTINWYRAQQKSGADMRALTLQQINAYETLVQKQSPGNTP
ncbi:MAG: CDP-glucose 4,6-dehydratase, partial [Proteobacteria bacterium]|nr:CDP-glucose 4,6-dehydratase [Pseudomonadota bacterium]